MKRHEVWDGIWVGQQSSCFHENRAGWTVVHACKSPCHRKAVGYEGSLPPSHPNYLTMRRQYHLYMNLVDPPVEPLFQRESFVRFQDFVRDRETSLLIHCNAGRSRSPSLALIHLAKGLHVIPNDDYPTARSAYEELDPFYSPRKGIETYLTENWGDL